MRVPPSRDFRILIAASIASQLGDWAARLALSLLVFARTGDPTTVGIVATVLVLPWLGPGQWLAAQGDRMDRRRLLILCDIVRGAIFLAIGLIELSLPLIILLVAVAATADPVFEANRSALVVDVVPVDDYPAAIQLANALNQAAQLVGFGTGGLLAALLGPSGALALNGGTFLLSALLLSRIKQRSEAQRKAAMPRLSHAWEFLANDKLSLIAVSTTFVTVACAMAIESQAVVYGSNVAGLSAAGTGMLAAVVPAATLLSIVDLNADGNDREVLEHGLSLAFIASLPAAIFLGTGTNTAGAFVGFALVGLVFTFSTAANIAVGRRIPADIRAGTFGVLQALVFLATTLGTALGGISAGHLGSRRAAAAAMLVTSASSLAAVAALNSKTLADDRAPAHA